MIVPSNWDVSNNNVKLTSERSGNADPANNSQELCGVKGMSVDRAWEITTGSTDVVIAVLDSGINWCNNGVDDKIALNKSVLPPPENASGLTKTELEKRGVKFLDPDPYDLNNSGVFNVFQYSNDSRVRKVASSYGGYFCGNHISPEDLIRTFGAPTIPSRQSNPYYVRVESPDGFLDAIAGWNFVNNNNDAYDKVDYGHGTGEALDSVGAPGVPGQEAGTYPNCMILPVRVGDSFITSANLFGQGVLFATDSNADVIQEALGTLDYTSFPNQAIDYAYNHGIPIMASSADEESQHDNLPSGLEHTIVVNSITWNKSFNPSSYLYLNGCANYGGNISVSVESQSCSSEATGKAAGIVGLIESEAKNLYLKKKFKTQTDLKKVNGKPVILSVSQVKELLNMEADDVNFQDGAFSNGNRYPPDNLQVGTPYNFVKTTRYKTTPGWGPYTGYGRLNVYRSLSLLSHGNLMPSVEITSPSWFNVFPPNSTVAIAGSVKAYGNTGLKYQVEIGPGPKPKKAQ